MTNTTGEFWAVDGVSLQTFAYNITSWGGDREAPPPVRGDVIVIPGDVGSKWVPKQADSRTMTLAMWVQGAAADGTYPTGSSRIQQFEQNWSMLRKLLWNPYKQFTLTKRILQSDGSFITVNAKGQYAGGLNPTMIGNGGAATFTVDVFLADPFFYGDPVAAPVGFDFTVLGDARVHDITLTGVAAGATISNATAGISLTNTNASPVTIGVRKWSALSGTTSLAAGITNVSDDSDDHWFFLDPTVQRIAGSVGSVAYQPRYF